MSLKSDNVEFVRYCGGHFENGDRKKISNVGNQFRTSLSTHISNFDDIRQMADILKIFKTQNCSSNGDLSLCQILCLYHYPFRSYQH